MWGELMFALVRAGSSSADAMKVRLEEVLSVFAEGEKRVGIVQRA